MRRLLALLLALAIGAPAHADTALVIFPANQLTTSPTNFGWEAQIVTSMIRNYGGVVDIYQAANCTTAQATAGTYSAPGFGSKHYDAQIIIGYNALSLVSAFRPDLLFNVGVRPAIPTLLINEPTHNNNEMGTLGSSSDSTGFGGPTLGVGSYQSFRITSAFVVGYPEVFRSMSVGILGPLTPTASRLSTLRGGIYRPIIGLATCSIGLRDGGLRNFTDADSLVITTAKRQDPDTVSLAAFYRSAAEPGPIFVFHPVLASGLANSGATLMALAALDSAAGRKVLGTGARALTLSIMIRSAFSRGHYNHLGFAETGGTFCYGDSCDSATVKARLDSLRTLAARYFGATGCQYTVLANVDSVAAYPNEKGWWSKLEPYVSYSPMSNAGVTGNNSAGAASYYQISDVFGRQRVRQMVAPGQTIPYACPAADSCLYCLIKASFARADSLWPGKTDHGLAPAIGDYLPVNFTRAVAGSTWGPGTSVGADSLFWVFYKAGARAIVVDPDFASSKPGDSWDQINGVNTAPGTNPLAFGPEQKAVPVFATPGGNYPTQGGVIASLKLLCTRGWPTDPGTPFDPTHDNVGELLWGRTCGRWYMDTGLVNHQQYSHHFDTGLSVLEVTASNLGGAGLGGVSGIGWTGSPGMYQIKWLVMEVAEINRLAGRQLIKFTKLEDNVP